MIKNPGTGGLSTGTGGSLAQPYTDGTGTPGNITINTPRGRASIASGNTACIVTNSSVAATSSVFVSLRGLDTTATSVRVSSPGPGSFTVTANASATANTVFDFLVVN